LSMRSGRAGNSADITRGVDWKWRNNGWKWN